MRLREGLRASNLEVFVSNDGRRHRHQGRQRHKPVTLRRQPSPVQIGRVILYLLGPRPHRCGLFLWGASVGAAGCEGIAWVDRWGALGFGLRAKAAPTHAGGLRCSGDTCEAIPNSGQELSSVVFAQQSATATPFWPGRVLGVTSRCRMAGCAARVQKRALAAGFARGRGPQKRTLGLGAGRGRCRP
jgi:hypothetical protein